jgi:DNA repair exonuclease SbcCD ATPase subunit
LSRERNAPYGSTDSQEIQTAKNGVSLLAAAESLRSSANPVPCPDEPPSKAEDKISLFWRVFGGTILSIVALVAITVFNSFSSSLAELRREINDQHQSRAELVKKEELSSRVSSLWNGIKDLQTANQTLSALNERSKLLDQQFDRHMKSAEDDRKELTRKLDEQRKLLEEEKRELTRKLDEQRKAFEEERKEMNRTLQALAERVAKVEGRQNAKSSLTGPVKPKE